jgi:hypothetical protein
LCRNGHFPFFLNVAEQYIMLAHVKTIMAIFCIVSFVFARYLITIGDYISWLCAAGSIAFFFPIRLISHFFNFSHFHFV